jgi:hypothetical protein
MMDAVRVHLHDHAQLGQEGLLFWRDDGGNVTDTEWRAAWLRACASAGVAGGCRAHHTGHGTPLPGDRGRPHGPSRQGSRCAYRRRAPENCRLSSLKFEPRRGSLMRMAA